MGEGTTEKVRIQYNRQYLDTLESKKRFIIHQGGTRSGKSWGILQALLYYSIKKTGKVITICRKTMPALKGTILRDWKAILISTHIWEQIDKAEKTSGEDNFYNYNINGNFIEFIGADDEQKVRGRKRNILFMNEANEFSLEDFRQLNFRTEEKVILDFNPSDPIHWIYDEVMPRTDCDTFISTYLDNMFLPETLIHEIEYFKGKDDEYWKVFGLGLRGSFLKGQIFKNWKKIDQMPEGDYFYGLDFGFSNDVTACCRILKENDRLYIEEILYQKGLTNSEIATFLKAIVSKSIIYADSSEPKSIKEISEYGLNIKPADRGKDSINAGINKLKEFDVYCISSSKNLWKEILYYQWEENKAGEITNTPKDFMNHLMDAIRYAVYTKYAKKGIGWGLIKDEQNNSSVNESGEMEPQIFRSGK